MRLPRSSILRQIEDFKKAMWSSMEAKRDSLEVPTQDQGLSDDLGASNGETRPECFSLAQRHAFMLSRYHDVMISGGHAIMIS
jgi:hypothetical protein